MGNISAKQIDESYTKKFDNFYEIIDYIATYYILTMDFKSLKKLTEKEYCDKLIILTSDIIKKYFNDLEISYLAQRIKQGIEVNEMTKDKIVFLNKDNLNDLDIQNDIQKTTKKKRVCIGIARFYVKIAHIFAAIVMTINPVYMYKDEFGNLVKSSLLEKDKIPKNVTRKIYKLNICDNRLHSLKRTVKDSSNIDVTGKVIDENNTKIYPNICSMNINESNNVKTLDEEPGIKELMQLYLDDEYDYSTGTFKGMSDKTKEKYMKDLKTFYTAFTGNENMPPEITKFSDIKIRKYYTNNNGCEGTKPFYKQAYNVSKSDKLFIEYSKSINNMLKNAVSNQNKLLEIINKLFSFVIDPYSKKRKIRVNPSLNEDELQIIVEQTRKLVMNLYINCEKDYVTSIKIYEAIVENKILETTQSQIEYLENEAKKLVQT